MNTTAACINAADLMRLLRNELTDSELTAIREHAQSCQSCARLLQDVAVQSVANVPPANSHDKQDTRHGRTASDTLGISVHESVPAPQLAAPPITQLGGYRLIRQLGGGGMGDVYLAEDVALGRQVALKVMRAELLKEPTARERFLREARAAATLKSDRIVTIYQVGDDNGVPFLSMELLTGESLEDRLVGAGHMEWKEILVVGRQVAEGLALAHNRGIIHRDIKPANVWLETCPNEPCGFRVKILDFGLARCSRGNGQLSTSGQLLGTPQYMSPEQAVGESVDARADLFSLGCMLYRMACGSHAFPGDSVLTILAALATLEPKPLDEAVSDSPSGFSKLVHRLLAKKADDRPASAEIAATELANIERALPDRRPAEAAPRRISPAKKSGWIAIAACAGVLVFVVFLAIFRRHPSTSAAAVAPGEPIRVGILYPTTGTLAESGQALVDAATFAIEEINSQGGIGGRPIEPVLRDGHSDPATFAAEADRMITEDKVAVIFGCWTSASRKAVKAIVEKRDHLLLYPLQYEGLEQSPNIVYLGAAPNQQIRPAVKHFYAFEGKRRFYLVGSDYVFPRAANAILRDDVKELGAEVVGESYLPLGSPDVAAIVSAIRKSRCDVIFNTINGDSNRAFFRELQQQGITPDRIPTVSFSISENELKAINPRDVAGDYAAWNYFQSVDRPANQRFVEKFKTRFGKLRVTSDPMEAAYTGVYLWAEAAKASGNPEPRTVLAELRGRTFDAPEGRIRIDPVTQHMHKHFRLGRIKSDGQFEIVLSTENLIPPEPFPASRTRAQWETFLNDLNRRWNGRWERPEE